MAFEGYGGYVWSDERTENRRSLFSTAATTATFAGGVALGTSYLLNNNDNGDKRLDIALRAARAIGDATPFQIGNTFRIPEFGSPWASSDYQKLENNTFTIGKEHLKHQDTYTYIKSLSNKTDSELRALGITPRMKGLKKEDQASSLIYERGTGSKGTLYSVHNNERKELAKDVMLMRFSGEGPSVGGMSSKGTPVNKAVKGVLQAINIYADEAFQESRLFLKTDKGESFRPEYIPVPGISASYTGSTYLRAFPAFAMERFNHLLQGVSEEVLGKDLGGALNSITGIGKGVLPGPASHMYARFGLKAAGVLGVGVGLSQLDWIRRQGGSPGHAAISATTSIGLGALAAKVGFKPKTSVAISAAAFTGQMLLPGFKDGLLPGVVTTLARVNEIRATGFNPFGYYRRTVEGFLPGISSPSMGILAGVGVLAAANMRHPSSGKRMTEHMLSYLGHDALGIAKNTLAGDPLQVPKSVREHHWDLLMQNLNNKVPGNKVKAIYADYIKNNNRANWSLKYRAAKEYYNSNMSWNDMFKSINGLHAVAEEAYKREAPFNPFNTALKESLDNIASQYNGKGDFLSRSAMHARGFLEQAKYAFFGADLGEELLAKGIKSSGFYHTPGRASMLFGAGVLAHGILTGSLFGTKESSQELRDIYSGRQLVNVNKNRFWEAGGTELEGHGSGDLRPHWIPIMLNRVRQKGTWGTDEDAISPIGKFLRSNFTYELERRNYYNRPYPISAPAFQNVPIIGPILGATIGRIIKPPRIMHANEWIQEGNYGPEFASVYRGFKQEPAYNLGAKDPGVPVSPYNNRALVGDIYSHFNELGGLVGWVNQSITKALTGNSTFFTSDPRLASSEHLTSSRDYFWESALGGAGPFGELIRRILPTPPKASDKVNPIVNTMPSWLSDRWRYGDPYSNLPFGEASLPGAGYEALHPEIAGIDPEDYPLVYRYDILSQVAPLSEEYREAKNSIYRSRVLGGLSPDQESMVDRIDRQTAARWNMYDFPEYDENAITLPGSGLVRRAYGQAQKVVRKTVAPIEYLIPGGIRPIQKLMGNRDAIEQYEYERLYGTPYAFWDKPWRDYIRPAMSSLANIMGYTGKPAWRARTDDINQYFDELEFAKNMQLADQAAAMGDTQNKIRFEYMAANTRMGVNPQGNPLSIYWSLPQEDRAFFNAFSLATGSDRKRIKQMVPEDQVHLYEAMWSRLDNEDPGLYPGLKSGPDSAYMQGQYLNNMDIYPRPPVDWIGNNADVDMRDIKVKYVNELGADMRDYGLWERDMKKVDNQPYLNRSTNFLHMVGGPRRGAMGRLLNAVLNTNSEKADLQMFDTNNYMSSMRLEYNDDRRYDIANSMENYIGN